MSKLPSPLQIRDLAMQVMGVVTPEHYLEGRDRQGRAERYPFRPLTITVINPDQQTALVEAYGEGWLYRVKVARNNIVRDTFVGDEQRCCEDFMAARMAL